MKELNKSGGGVLTTIIMCNCILTSGLFTRHFRITLNNISVQSEDTKMSTNSTRSVVSANCFDYLNGQLVSCNKPLAFCDINVSLILVLIPIPQESIPNAGRME